MPGTAAQQENDTDPYCLGCAYDNVTASNLGFEANHFTRCEIQDCELLFSMGFLVTVGVGEWIRSS